MITEKQHEKINLSKRSGFILEGLDPILNKQRDGILSKMKGDFRDGKLDHISMVSHVAQLCSLDDLEQSLKTDIKKGQKVREELANATIN